METNPYIAPQVDQSAADDFADKSETISAIAKKTFLAWERRRLIYNGVLVPLTLATAGVQPQLFATVEFWGTAIFGAVFANLCFFAAPILDTYATWLGFDSQLLRAILLGLGTIFASILAMFTVLTLG